MSDLSNLKKKEAEKKRIEQGLALAAAQIAVIIEAENHNWPFNVIGCGGDS